jgi:hypothetical protein
MRFMSFILILLHSFEIETEWVQNKSALSSLSDLKWHIVKRSVAFVQKALLCDAIHSLAARAQLKKRAFHVGATSCNHMTTFLAVHAGDNRAPTRFLHGSN